MKGDIIIANKYMTCLWQVRIDIYDQEENGICGLLYKRFVL